jgi:NADH dehydrogenase (ubiquinone) Fe-S protein 2
MEAEIGLLHRGTEKLIELRNWNQSINYFNRLDYVSLVAQEEIYCYTIEKSLNLRISHLSSLIRVIFLEISRIFNHLLAVVTHAIDIGAFSPFLWAFEEREKLIEFYEAS